MPHLKKGFTVSNALTPFDFEGNPVRVVMIDDQPRFVVNDVCQVLDIANPHNAVARIPVEYLRQAEVLDGRGIPRSTNVVNEPGLYELIFRSDKPEAVRFRRWVFEEVLPAIRETGGYVGQADAITQRAMRDIEILKAAKELMSPQSLEAEALRAVRRGLQFVEVETKDVRSPDTLDPTELPQVTDFIGVKPAEWTKHIPGIASNAKLQKYIVTVLADHAGARGLTEAMVRHLVTARWYAKGRAPSADGWVEAWHRVAGHPIVKLLDGERWTIDATGVANLKARHP